MSRKGRVLVPEDDTHKQTITDVYKIYKTSYSKCYDSEEEMFFCDVVHHLEQHSTSTVSEPDSLKHQVYHKKVEEAFHAFPRWSTHLPTQHGVNVTVSLTCDHLPEDSLLDYIPHMGIEMIEYVKLRIGYNYLRSYLNKMGGETYSKAICPGLTGRIEDAIVLRMLHMQYINSEDYVRWVLRSTSQKDSDKTEKDPDSQNNILGALRTKKEWWKPGKESSAGMQPQMPNRDEGIKKVYSIESNTYEDKTLKEDMPPLNASEQQHIIMLTQYEVNDQELPEDIDVFWPGKRDLENDFYNFKNALTENLLYQQFIQTYKSGKCQRLDDDAKLESKEYFLETSGERNSRIQPRTVPPVTGGKKGRKKCSWQDLKEKFKDYKISQDVTLSLFDNVIKEKARLENLNLCCIISKLKEIHKENPSEVENEDEIIWKDMVIVRTRSEEAQTQHFEEVINVIGEEEINVIGEEEEAEDDTHKGEEEKQEPDCTVVPEFKSMIYVTKVFPELGIYYQDNTCKLERKHSLAEDKAKWVCSGYSMRDYKSPLVPQCSFKTTPLPPPSRRSLREGQTSIRDTGVSARNSDQINNTESLSLWLKPGLSKGLLPEDYVTFHTDWSNYPYTEMVDIVFHRHHRGYIYITDVFEIMPDTLREINRIFHKIGKASEEECCKNAVNSYVCRDPEPPPPCCKSQAQKSHSTTQSFPFGLSPDLESFGEDEFLIRKKSHNTNSPKNYQLGQDSETLLPTIFNADPINYQAVEVKRRNVDGDADDDGSETSSDDLLEYDSDTNYYFERFQTSEVSSVGFESHRADAEQLDSKYPVRVDYSEVPAYKIDRAPSDQDDDYSDIVDFIKNFRSASEGHKNYERPTEAAEAKDNDALTGLLAFLNSNPSKAPEKCVRLKKSDESSVNSDDTYSLKDIKGLFGDKCSRHTEQQPATSEVDDASQVLRLKHNVSGEFYSAIVDKRSSVLQELRTSFPLVYLYLTLKTNFSKINITGKLIKYRKHFQSIDQEYQAILKKFNLPRREETSSVEEFIDHRHFLYAEIYGKYKAFDFETYSMTILDPFIRHLTIREAFQDIGTNLSFFLLQFIENDRFNLLYRSNEKETADHQRIIKNVYQFLRVFRKEQTYKRFLLDLVVIHYFETRKFFTLERLMMLDLNWEDIFLVPRTIKCNKGLTTTITFKDSVLQGCSSYSYLFYNLIKQFNDLFYSNNLFRQFLEPELHPKRIKDMTFTELNNLITKECLNWCDISLKNEVEMDMNVLIKTIWKCELLGYNKFKLFTSHIYNRFPNETGNYFNWFFPNIVTVRDRNEQDCDDLKQTPNEMWRYNREFHYWYCSTNMNKTSTKFLTMNNLHNFEKLLTECLLQSIITFYEYKLHG